MDSGDKTMVAAIIRYRSDVVAFVREVIHAEPDEDQEAILRAIAEPGSRVSVKSGHGTGKTATLAWAILWFLCCHGDCKIPCTAPSSNQLFDNLWAEIGKWRARLNGWFAAGLRQLSDRLEVIGAERTRFAAARTAKKEQPEALQGFHATNLLFVVDEASGVPEEVFTVAEGSLSTPGARMVLISNPTRSDGYFYDSHHKDRARWRCFTLNAERSPRVSREETERKAAKYGRESNYYRVRVLGEFPLASDDTLIPLEWVTSAVGRDIIIPAGTMRRVAGLDVARFGDDACALAVRRGPVLTFLDEWRQTDLMATVGRVVRAYRQDHLFDLVAVDVIGMGSGVVDRLREQSIPVLGVNVAEAPAMQGRFMRLRDQLWWEAREWFQGRGCRIEPGLCAGNRVTGDNLGDQLTAELTTIRYGIESSGKVKVEGKDEMKKRGLASPNLADAVCLTFAVTGDTVADAFRPEYMAGGAMLGEIEIPADYPMSL